MIEHGRLVEAYRKTIGIEPTDAPLMHYLRQIIKRGLHHLKVQERDRFVPFTKLQGNDSPDAQTTISINDRGVSVRNGEYQPASLEQGFAVLRGKSFFSSNSSIDVTHSSQNALLAILDNSKVDITWTAEDPSNPESKDELGACIILKNISTRFRHIRTSAQFPVAVIASQYPTHLGSQNHGCTTTINGSFILASRLTISNPAHSLTFSIYQSILTGNVLIEDSGRVVNSLGHNVNVANGFLEKSIALHSTTRGAGYQSSRMINCNIQVEPDEDQNLFYFDGVRLKDVALNIDAKSRGVYEPFRGGQRTSFCPFGSIIVSPENLSEFTQLARKLGHLTDKPPIPALSSTIAPGLAKTDPAAEATLRGGYKLAM